MQNDRVVLNSDSNALYDNYKHVLAEHHNLFITLLLGSKLISVLAIQTVL